MHLFAKQIGYIDWHTLSNKLKTSAPKCTQISYSYCNHNKYMICALYSYNFWLLKCSYLKIECWAQLLFWPQPAALPGSGAGHDEHLSVSEGHPGALASASWSFWYVHWWTASQTSVLKNGKGMKQKKTLKWRVLFKKWLDVKCAKQFLTISVFA